MLYFVNGITIFQVSNFSPSNHPPSSQLLPPLPKLTETFQTITDPRNSQGTNLLCIGPKPLPLPDKEKEGDFLARSLL